MDPKTPPFGGNHKIKSAENEGGKSFDDTDFEKSSRFSSEHREDYRTSQGPKKSVAYILRLHLI
jgi:hypothetical protein